VKRKYAWKPDIPDHRDRLFEEVKLRRPKKVDRLGLGNQIEDQGDLGSCTGNAVTSAIEIVTKVPHSLSRLMCYYGGRRIENTLNEDSGCQIRDVIKSVQDVGVCKEELYPYDIKSFTKHPSLAAKRDALNVIPLIKSYTRVTSLNQVKNALARGLPVIFGFVVPVWFPSPEVRTTGWVPMPKEEDKVLGGHAVTAVGYDDTVDEPFIWVRNSWGPKWGIDGYFKMDQEWFMDLRGLVDDMWVIEAKA